MCNCLKAVPLPPEIHVVCAAPEAQGISHSIRINTTKKCTEMIVEIERMLAKSATPEVKTFLIQDYGGFGSFEISPDEALERVRCKALLILEYGELAVKLTAYYNGDLNAAVKALHHRYIGVYDSELEYAMAFLRRIMCQIFPQKRNPITISSFKKIFLLRIVFR